MGAFLFGDPKMPKIYRFLIITTFLFLFSTFAKAQAMISYLYLEVVDSNQKPVADAAIETPSAGYYQEKPNKTGSDGLAKFMSYSPIIPTGFRIVRPDYYPFELFGLLKGNFRENNSYEYKKLKIELLKIPQTKDEKEALGDEQLKRDFFLAVLQGNSAEVRRMLKAGINPNITTDDLRGVPAPKEIPAILYAAYNKDIATMNEFLSAKINLQNENSNIHNLLAYYISNLNDNAKSKEELSVFNEYVDKLLKAGARLNSTDIYGKTLLTIAAQQNNVELVKKLIKNGVNVNSKNRYGSTALTEIFDFYGSKPDMQRLEIIKFLLKSGANPNIIRDDFNGDCYFPLKYSAHFGQIELVRLLLSYKADAKLKCKNGENALSRAYSENSIYSELANFLIDAGADANAAIEGGTTPLMRAVLSANVSLVKKMLDKGADVKGKQGTLTLKIAKEKLQSATNRNQSEEIANFQGIVKLLEAAGAK